MGFSERLRSQIQLRLQLEGGGEGFEHTTMDMFRRHVVWMSRLF